ncbi:hypothetical protein D210916BOD24_21410 [Alteromonas sp. D210916BOD_24]|uniref:hypothetical protein n=1 Tax=Alteromonas sp. D210916BOD_24 TaxID=3157618 RepID=UPI00399C5CE3
MEFTALVDIAPELAELSAVDRSAIELFTLTWSIFESKKLDRNASIPKIEEKLAEIEIDEVFFEDTLDYFKRRYFPNGQESYHFEYLNIKRPETKIKIENALKGEISDPKELLLICLIIIYRFRNNLFHGEKWVYGIQGQQENFEFSVDLLKQCMRLFPDGI